MQVRFCLVRCTAAFAALALSACGDTAPATPPPAAASAQRDYAPIAKNLVAAGMIKAGDRVLISGSVRDNTLLEHLAIETMKVGGQPLVTIGSDAVARRSFTEVPDTYDSQPQTLGLAIATSFEAQIVVDIGESDSVLAGVPASRIAARAKAGQPVGEAFLKRNARLVNLGNGLYPTASLAARLGKPEAELADIFWRAASVDPATFRAVGDPMLATIRAAKQLTITSANGTNISFAVTGAKGFVSDGVITAEKVKQGGAAVNTWLPAGELLVPVTLGTAEGKIVVDKVLVQGTTVEGLTLTFSKGKLTAMTATAGLDPLKAQYDAASGGKDALSYIDIGINPEAKLPTNTGRLVWMAPGGITIGLGDNTGWGGTNASSFALSGALTAPTLAADGKNLIEGGTIK